MSKSNRTGGRAAQGARRARDKSRKPAPAFALPGASQLNHWQPVAAIVLGLLVTVVLGRALALAVEHERPTAIVSAGR